MWHNSSDGTAFIAPFSIEQSLIIIPQCLPFTHICAAHNSIHWNWHNSCIIRCSSTLTHSLNVCVSVYLYRFLSPSHLCTHIFISSFHIQIHVLLFHLIFFVVYFPKCKCEVVFFVCPIFVVKRLSKCDAVLRDPQHPIISISKCIPALAKIVLKTYACTKRWSKLLYMRSDASKPLNIPGSSSIGL